MCLFFLLSCVLYEVASWNDIFLCIIIICVAVEVEERALTDSDIFLTVTALSIPILIYFILHILRYRLYSTDYTEEQILHHACNYITFFLCRGDGSEEIQFDGEINHMDMLVKEAEWLLAADIVSKEVYSRIIMRLFSENLSMEGFIENVLADEVGLLDDSIFLNLNIIGGAVVERLRCLNIDVYSEIDRKKLEAKLIAYEAEYRSTLKEKVGEEEGLTHLNEEDKEDAHSDPLILDDVSSGNDLSLVSSILNKILTGENVDLEQLHVINKYLNNVMEDEEVMLSSAFSSRVSVCLSCVCRLSAEQWKHSASYLFLILLPCFLSLFFCSMLTSLYIVSLFC